MEPNTGLGAFHAKADRPFLSELQRVREQVAELRQRFEDFLEEPFDFGAEFTCRLDALRMFNIYNRFPELLEELDSTKVGATAITCCQLAGHLRQSPVAETLQ